MREQKTVKDYLLMAVKDKKFVNSDGVRYNIVDIFTQRDFSNHWQTYSRIKYEDDNIDIFLNFSDVVNHLESVIIENPSVVIVPDLTKK